MTTIDKLNRLAELQAKRDELQAKLKADIDGVIPPEVKQAIADFELLHVNQAMPVQEEIATLEESIRSDVLAAGVTAKGEHLICTWNKPRVSWDTKGLDGYAVAHPELNAFRKEGEPSTTIKAVRG